jgi:hypothetical protein
LWHSAEGRNTVSSHTKGQESTPLSLKPYYKNVNPIGERGALFLPSQRSHFLILLDWRLSFNINFGEDTIILTIAPAHDRQLLIFQKFLNLAVKFLILEIGHEGCTCMEISKS